MISPELLALVSGLLAILMAPIILKILAHSKTYPPGSSVFHADSFLLIAHRGGSAEAPENTLEAFDHATSLHPKIAIEFDVQLSKDGQVVVFHDSTLDRTTDGQGPVNEKTLSELKALDAGFNFTDSEGQHTFRGKGVQIPTLSQVLERYPQTRMILEMKGHSVVLADSCAQILRDHEANERVICFSQQEEPVKHLYGQVPHWSFGATIGDTKKSLFYSALFLEALDPMVADVYSIPELYGGRKVLTRRLLKEVHRRQKRLYVWTVNDRKDMERLIQFGVDGLISDHPTVLLEVVKERLGSES